jgi:triosephosphate isomerase
MRKKIIAGNWKMHLTRAESVTLAQGIAEKALQYKSVDVVLCPTFTNLDVVRGALAGTVVELGAQNMCAEPKGAFTGEISSGMLVDVGCKYVILGHSERRTLYKETDADVNKKVHAALAANLIPIVCVGELLAEREAGQTKAVVTKQFEGSLAGVTPEQMVNIVIAYEPVWAIGTGKVATPEQAEEVHRDLRKLIETRYNSQIANSVRIQYGGSVKPDNAKTLLGQPNIDGALVGGASLKVEDFLGIIAGGAEAAK